jgi:hypothetical protein
MTNRDTFAAAALTGLIASREWPIDSEEAAHYCYRVADAMLRERERTNHDAAPAAIARTDSASCGRECDGTDKPVTLPAVGTGDIPCSRTRDIVTRLRRWCHAVDAESAQDLMDEAATEIERLRLTSEEREAVADAAGRYVEGITPKAQEYAAALRALLERTK